MGGLTQKLICFKLFNKARFKKYQEIKAEIQIGHLLNIFWPQTGQKTLSWQLCDFPNHVQSIEFTTGWLKV